MSKWVARINVNAVFVLRLFLKIENTVRTAPDYCSNMRREIFATTVSLVSSTECSGAFSVFWMSVRLTVSVFYRNGTALLRFRRANDAGLLVRTGAASRNVHTRALNPVVANRSPPSSAGWKNRWNHARRAFVDNLLSRVTNSLSSDLRRHTARQLMYGNSRPFFALVGVSLASGNGMLTNDHQLEGVCWEIRVSFFFFLPLPNAYSNQFNNSD